MNEAIAEQKFAKKDIFQYFFKKIFLQFLRWFCQSQQKYWSKVSENVIFLSTTLGKVNQWQVSAQ